MKQKKSEWEEKFKTLRLMNKRDPLVWGHVNYISNTNPSASDFKTLKDRIVKIAETSPNWGEDYPVRWINLEKVLGRERTKGNNVLSVEVVKEMAMNCSVPIRQEKEVILFLKFQHERGNLIFFDEKELRDCIILDPSWVSDAFKCIVFADECTKDSHQQSTLPEFRQNGKITKALLRKMIEHKNPKYKGHFDKVVGVMTKFDIIVKDKQDSFICPSVITRKAVSFKTICDKENINKTSCFRSPWLCIEFNFLPPALFNHLLVFCMRDDNFGNAELFNEIGIFCIKGSTDLDKFFLCKSGRTIALQIFTRNEIVQNAQSLYKTILHTLTTITSKYGYTVYYTPKILCGETDYSSDKGRHLFDDIKRNGFGYCYHCKDKHTAEYYSVWFKVSNVKIKLLLSFIMNNSLISFCSDMYDRHATNLVYFIKNKCNKFCILKNLTQKGTSESKNPHTENDMGTNIRLYFPTNFILICIRIKDLLKNKRKRILSDSLISLSCIYVTLGCNSINIDIVISLRISFWG